MSESESPDKIEARLRALLRPAASAHNVWQRIQTTVQQQPAAPNLFQRWRLGVLDLVVAAAVIALCFHTVLQTPPAPHRGTNDPAPDGSLATMALSTEERSRIDALIKALRSDSSGERDAAARELIATGERALPSLDAIITGDDALRQRIEEVIEKIVSVHAIAQLEKFAPGLPARLANRNVDERQNAAITWASTADRNAAVGVLIDLIDELEYGPVLHGCLDALNYLAAREAFLPMNAPPVTLNIEESPVTTALTQLFDRIEFSPGARVLCDTAPASKVPRKSPRRLIVAQQLANLRVTYSFDSGGGLHILTRPEAAEFWEHWWMQAQRTPEWRGEDISAPTAVNILRWLKALDGADHAATIRSTRFLINNWNVTAVQDALKQTAAGKNAAASRARDIMSVVKLRHAGKIYFQHRPMPGQQAVYEMNPDGSELRMLFPGDVQNRRWALFGVFGRRIMLKDWNKPNPLHWWQEGMPQPVQINDAGVALPLCALPGTDLFLYQHGTDDASEKQVVAYNFRLQTSQPFTDANQRAVFAEPLAFPSLSLDNRRLCYAVAGKKSAAGTEYAVWLTDLDTRQSRQLLPATGGTMHLEFKWSPDGRWISCSRVHANPNGGTAHDLTVINVAIGGAQSLVQAGLRGGSMAWDRYAPRLYFTLTDPEYNETGRSAYGNLRLYCWEAGKPLSEFSLPPVLQKEMESGASIRVLNTEIVLYTHGAPRKEYLIDTTGKEPPRAFAGVLDRRTKISFNGETWFLSEGRIAGTFSEQALLISENGRVVVPLTNLPDRVGVTTFQKRAP